MPDPGSHGLLDVHNGGKGPVTVSLAIMGDGTVLVRSTMSNWSNTVHPEGSFVTTEDYLISLSNTGSVQWKKDILSEIGNYTYCNGPMIDANGTLQLVFRSGNSQTAVGLNNDGSTRWVDHEDHLAFPGTEDPGNIMYLVENYDDQPWGYPTHPISTYPAGTPP
jgi:hypothetical protein